MNGRIGLVFELAHEEPAMLLREFSRLGQHAAAFQRRRREHDPRAEKAHQASTLDAEVLGHRDDERITFGRADHRQRNARCCRSSPRSRSGRVSKLAGLLGGFDGRSRHAVLDRAHRVERFQLAVEH